MNKQHETIAVHSDSDRFVLVSRSAHEYGADSEQVAAVWKMK